MTVFIGIMIFIIVFFVLYMKHLRYVFEKTKDCIRFTKSVSPKHYDSFYYYIPIKDCVNYKKSVESADFRYINKFDNNVKIPCRTDINSNVALMHKKTEPFNRLSLKSYADVVVAGRFEYGNSITKLRYDFGKPIISDNIYLNENIAIMRVATEAENYSIEK